MLVRREAYTSQAGQESTLLVWQSHCPVYDDLFEAKTKAKGEPARRCPEHRAAGTPVGRKKARPE